MSIDTIHYQHYSSPLGQILIAANSGGLIGLWFENQKYEMTPQETWQHTPQDTALKKATEYLKAYFKGDAGNFNAPLNLSGTDFQKSVWSELQKISYGETITYGELAKRLGKPTAVRAAAAAVGRNPASIVVPCHRVVGSNGSLTGYAGGLERKQHMLELENAIPSMSQAKIATQMSFAEIAKPAPATAN